MKVKCALSGVEFKAQGFGVFRATAQHPLISAPLIDLIREVLPLYYMDKLNEPETRVLFVAFLKHSDLVEFEHHATPSLKTIHSNMQALVKTLDWSISKASSFSLPRYRITRSNCTLRNISQWISAWANARESWIDKQHMAGERTMFLIRQEALEKLIMSAYRTPEQYAGRLAKWALEASKAHPDRIPEWTEIFKLREPAIFNADKDEIADLLDHLESKLDAVNNTVAQTALKHIRTIAWKNDKGILYGLDDFEEEEQQLVLSRDQGTPYVMLSRHERMLRMTIENAPILEPKAADYPNRVAYLVAKARYDIKTHIDTTKMAAKDEIKIARNPIAIIEERNLLDAGFDTSFDTETVDEAEGTYEEIADDIVIQALNDMEAASNPIIKVEEEL